MEFAPGSSYFTDLCLMSALVLYASLTVAQPIHGSQNLTLGFSSSSPETNQIILVSPDATFSAGFYKVGINAYSFAIWYSNTPKPRTVVWLANGDTPVNGKASRLLLHKDGDLLLFDADGSVIWKTDTRGLHVNEAALLNTGNLVLSSYGKIVWQSFDSPGDTLLPHQPFTKDTQLVSRMRLGTYKSGYYRFFFNDDNYLSLIYEGLNLSSKYWPHPWLDAFSNGRTTYNITRLAALDGFGRFSSSDQFSFNASDYGQGPMRRLTLDADGNLRLYSLNTEHNGWNITWMAVAEQCRVHGLCGLNGVCIYTPQPKCLCPPGFEREDSMDMFKGCRLIKKITCGPSTTKFIRLRFTDYYGFDNGYTEGVSWEKCRKTCMDDCNCLGFGYRHTGTGQCFPKTVLASGYQSTGVDNDMYIKISVNDSSLANVSSPFNLVQSGSVQCPQRPVPLQNRSSIAAKKSRTSRGRIIPMASFVCVIGVTEIVCIAVGWWFLIRNIDDANVYNCQGYFSLAGGLKRFTFSELRRATNNFEDSVGKGGFGTVYKGYLLAENKVVAVKRLEGVSQGEDEFWAEVSMIGRVNHMNLTRLFGYCAEKKYRLLVYEYVENGSLDKYLFAKNSSWLLDWNKRLQIAMGTAKGLAYLHEECLEWILHCDIKPQNILLDEQFRAKVSDFGLSKLVNSGHDRDRALTFSTIRGTRGYLAPEWTMNLPITAKADVYSFGILLLELVSGQDAAKFNVSGSAGNFVQWASDNVKARKWIENLVDAKLVVERNSEVEVEVERVLNTALLCVEQDKDRRPSMSEIVAMLTAPSNSEEKNRRQISPVSGNTGASSDSVN